MPIEKISAAQFRQQLRSGINDRNAAHDTGFGPVKDIVIDPAAAVLERQNDRIRSVSLLVSLSNSGDFTSDDLDALVFNEGLTRIQGSNATTNVVFSTLTVDTLGPDLVVPRGFPIATPPDSATGESLTFVTTEERTLDAALAASFKNFDVDPPQFELTVPVVSVSAGSAGNVGATRISRPLRPLVGFDSVSNPTAPDDGRDAETDAELIDRYLLAILGRDIVTPTGVERFARDNFPSVTDIGLVYGDNPLLTRAGDTPGAVDAYVVGESLLTQSENQSFVGINQLMQLGLPPVRQVTGVRNLTTGPTTYTEGTDYEVVLSTGTDLTGSTRAVEGIRFLPDDAVAPAPPDVDDLIEITYTNNNLIRLVQSTFDQDDTQVFGRDLLFKEGVRVDIVLEAQLRVAAGFSTVTVPAAVEAAVLDHINNLGLGAPVEISDLQGAVRAISGVDNFIITRMVRVATDTGAADITTAENEYARITAGADLTITLL